jgi:hypothetical protein
MPVEEEPLDEAHRTLVLEGKERDLVVGDLVPLSPLEPGRLRLRLLVLE